jgi:serine phosphatase RsbU (regulator of sigma subunit)
MARHHPQTPPPAPDRESGLRHVLLHTLPGRLIVIGLAIRLILLALGAVIPSVPAVFNVVDTAAGLAIAIGAAYFLVQLFVAAKRRLLWRVRRKLILSYIFVGFIPSILIVAFFLLGGFLLFYNLSTYLVQSRLRALGDQARFLAEGAVIDIQRAGGRDVDGVLGRRQNTAAHQFPGVSIAVVRFERPCDAAATVSAAPAPRAAAPLAIAGPWAHVRPPATVPSWVPCAGFGGLLAYASDTSEAPEAHLFGRGVALSDPQKPVFAVVADVLVDDDVLRRLRTETGVALGHMSAVKPTQDCPGPIAGRTPSTPAAGESQRGEGAPPLSSVSWIDYQNWSTGRSCGLLAHVQLSVGEIYDRISGSKGRTDGQSVGETLLLALGVIGFLFLVIECVALIAGLALAKSITGSIHELFTGTERVRQGDFTVKVPVKSDDQLGELTESFNSMTGSIEDLLRQAAEKRRLEEELRIAHEIQMSLLPQGPLQMPGLSVTALCLPAREVGGDYYDFLPLDDRRLGVLIADVSGKGTSAALYMAELKGLILSLSRIHRSPRELLINANKIIAEHLDARSFITMTYAVIDLGTRTMTYARAGHTPLIYLPGSSGGSRRVRILAPDGLVLGLKIDKGEMFERLLEEQTIPLGAGDLYLFFTDGITEAMNEGDDCFGEGRLGQLIEDHAHLQSAELRERVLREIEAFVGAAPQHDDMTLILLKIDEAAAPVAEAAAEIAETSV